MSILSDRLRALRIQNNYSQQELADKLNVNRSTVTLYETGVNEPPIEKLNKLSILYNVSIDYIIGKTNYKNELDAWTAWKEMDKTRFNNNKFEVILESLIEQVSLDDELTFEDKILSDKQKEIIIKQLKLINDLLAL